MNTHKKQIMTIVLSSSMNIISYGMHQNNTSLTPAQNGFNVVQSYASGLYNVINLYTSTASHQNACDQLNGLSGLAYSLKDTQLFRRECIVKKISKQVNELFLGVKPEESFSFVKEKLKTVYEQYITDYETAIQKLNAIEKEVTPLLHQCGYRALDEELIDKLRECNPYFNGLIKKVIVEQTDWSRIIPSNLDDFFKWRDVPLKNSRIGLYIHGEVMNIYADTFHLQDKTEQAFLSHMISRMISNACNNKEELLLLLNTTSFDKLKNKKTIQKDVASKIMRLEEQEAKQIEDKKLREGL